MPRLTKHFSHVFGELEHSLSIGHLQSGYELSVHEVLVQRQQHKAAQGVSADRVGGQLRHNTLDACLYLWGYLHYYYTNIIIFIIITIIITSKS